MNTGFQNFCNCGDFLEQFANSQGIPLTSEGKSAPTLGPKAPLAQTGFEKSGRPAHGKASPASGKKPSLHPSQFSRNRSRSEEMTRERHQERIRQKHKLQEIRKEKKEEARERRAEDEEKSIERSSLEKLNKCGNKRSQFEEASGTLTVMAGSSSSKKSCRR